MQRRPALLLLLLQHTLTRKSAALWHEMDENGDACCLLPGAADGSNLKALYRRGQARAGQKHWLAAEADLTRSRKLAAAANDEAQVRLAEGPAAACLGCHCRAGSIHSTMACPHHHHHCECNRLFLLHA